MNGVVAVTSRNVPTGAAEALVRDQQALDHQGGAEHERQHEVGSQRVQREGPSAKRAEKLHAPKLSTRVARVVLRCDYPRIILEDEAKSAGRPTTLPLR